MAHTKFRMTLEFEIPESLIDQSALMAGLKPAFDEFREALGEHVGDYEIDEKVVKPRDESKPRKPRKPREVVEPNPVENPLQNSLDKRLLSV